MPQYSKPLTLHKGVDNQIQFQFLNQEQRPVDITGKEITCRILNADGTAVVLTTALVLQLPLKGIAVLNINAADIENVDFQKCFYSLEFPVGAFDYPVFVDQNAGARGDLFIVNSVLPSFVPSTPVSIPTNQQFPNADPFANIGSLAKTYFSSVFSTQDNPVVTIQSQLTNYIGNITVQGSTINSGDWYDIVAHPYSNVSTTEGYTVAGYHPFIRLQFISNAGEVANILYR